MLEIPFSGASERNKDPILASLQPYLENTKSVLEVGSGTGQHAVYFAQNLPHLTWQTSDQAEYLSGIEAQLNTASQYVDGGIANLLGPITLDVTQANWLPEMLQQQKYDAVYSANTLHIMAWQQVQDFFTGLKQVTTEHGLLIIYGPFKYDGRFTSNGNQEFDQDLRSRGVGSAIRDFESVDELANQCGYQLVTDIAMPANNQCLIWQRKN